jgi:hypothetical protein
MMSVHLYTLQNSANTFLHAQTEKNACFFTLILNANSEPAALARIAPINIQKAKLLPLWENSKMANIQLMQAMMMMIAS